MAKVAYRKLSNYRQVQVSTASPGRKIVLLYEGIMKFLNNALAGFDIKSPAQHEIINSGIQQGRNIIQELKFALDLEKGGEIAENLEQLYDYWIEELYRINAEKDKEQLETIINMVSEMRNTWKKAEEEARKKGIN